MFTFSVKRMEKIFYWNSREEGMIPQTGKNSPKQQSSDGQRVDNKDCSEQSKQREKSKRPHVVHGVKHHKQ